MNYKDYPGKELKKYGELNNIEKPIVSIVTPFYNNGKEIEETFHSIMNQIYPYFEWIIVDDGSKDEFSINKLKEISKKDERIKVFTIENGGPSVARDYGISKTSSTSKYVFFLDSDDVIDKTMIECLYWTLETHKEASFAYTSTVNFGTREFIWEKYFTVEQEKEENLLTISALVRKEDLLEVGCFGIKEKAMYEDWNLWLKLIKKGKKPIRVSAPLFWYRQTNKGEFSKAKENNQNAMKYVEETAKDIPDDLLEAIQYPRTENRNDSNKQNDMILPDYKKSTKTSILMILPWLEEDQKSSLEMIKNLSQDDYHTIILLTKPSSNSMRQDFEKVADVYDLSSFIDRIDYPYFTDYMIASRKVDMVVISDTEYGYYMIPYLKEKHSIPIIDYINHAEKNTINCSKEMKDYLEKSYSNSDTLKKIKEEYQLENIEQLNLNHFSETLKKLLQEKTVSGKNKSAKLIYDLAIANYNNSYFQDTNNYYQLKFGINLNAKKKKNPRLHRHISYFLERIGAKKEGVIFQRFSEDFIKLIKLLWETLKDFFLVIPSLITFIYKCIKRIITKPFRH